MFETIKNYLGFNTVQSEEDKIFNTNDSISAKSAYMHTKYGQDQNQKALLKAFFKSANDLIKQKTMQNAYCCMLEIDEDIVEFVPHIIKRYRDELGYNVVIMFDDTEIKQGNEYIRINSGSTFIILMWNNPNIKDDTVSILKSKDVESLPDKIILTSQKEITE